MRRPKRSTDFTHSTLFCSTRLRCMVALSLVTLVLGCSSNSSGTRVENNSVIVVSPTGRPDSSPPSDSQNDNSNTPLINDEPNSTEGVSPIAVDGMPQDCMFDVSQSNETFCYQAKTRTLRAWTGDGIEWWSYTLPGDNTTNEIHALHVVNGNLYIIAELKTEGVQTGFEISSFEFDGAFKKTVAISKFQDYSFIAGQRIQVADINDNLIITGDYGLSSNNILPNQFNGTFIAVFNTTTDQIENSILYPQLRQTNPMHISGEHIILELEHLVYEVLLGNLELAKPIDRFQSIPFTRTNYQQKKHNVIGFIEKPPLENLHTQMNNAFSDALRIKRQTEPDAPSSAPVDCAGGGTVQQSVVVDDIASEVQTTTFENCSMAEFSAHGILLQRQSNTCGKNCEGMNRTLRALAFDVTYIDGESWSIDGYISINETQSTLSQSNGPIDDPEVVYANLTEINVFSISDKRLTIDLAPGRYQYDGTLKNGTGEWSGSGTVSYSTGITETFSVDLSRKLLNGVQVDFSGQVDANRSDDTALFIDADSDDQTGIRYTTTAAGESVQSNSTW